MILSFAANNGLHGSTGISFTGTVKSFAQIGYMDEFEYFDACICNRGVEKRRDVFHAWRKAQDVVHHHLIMRNECVCIPDPNKNR